MKTSKYNALRNMVAAPSRVSGIRNNSQEQLMLKEILRCGYVHTGYYQGRGRHIKAVNLTSVISAYLDKIGIAHETGNNAPRGGVSGNYVKVTMPAFMKEVKKVLAAEAAEREAAKKAAAEKAAIAEAQRQAQRKRINELVEENIEAFKALDLHAIVPWVPKDWTGRYYFTKKESKAVAHTISEISGIDYQLCIWFVRSERFMEIYNSK